MERTALTETYNLSLLGSFFGTSSLSQESRSYPVDRHKTFT